MDVKEAGERRQGAKEQGCRCLFAAVVATTAGAIAGGAERLTRPQGHCSQVGPQANIW